MLEILIVLTLIGMLSGVLVTGSMHLLREKPVVPEDVFWNAVGASRKTALLSGRDVSLSFQTKEKTRALVSRAADGSEQRHEFSGEAEVIVDFLAAQKGGSSMLLGGQLVETQTVRAVTFYGDGTCSPFRVQIRVAGTPRVMSIDPWTCAPVLTAADSPR